METITLKNGADEVVDFLFATATPGQRVDALIAVIGEQGS